MLHYIEHMYYHTCPLCGANLDPDEWCECEKKDESSNTDNYQNVQSKKTLKGDEEKHVNINRPHICHIG